MENLIFRFFKVLVEYKEDGTHFTEKLCDAYHNNYGAFIFEYVFWHLSVAGH